MNKREFVIELVKGLVEATWRVIELGVLALLGIGAGACLIGVPSEDEPVGRYALFFLGSKVLSLILALCAYAVWCDLRRRMRRFPGEKEEDNHITEA